MKFFIYTNNVYPGLATIIRSLLDNGHSVTLFADQSIDQPLTDNQFTWPFLKSEKRLTLLPCASLLETKIENLMLCWCHSIPYTQVQLSYLRQTISTISNICLLYDAHFGSNSQILKQQIKDWISHYWWLSKVNKICYVTIKPSFSLYCGTRNSFCLTVGPNQDCLFDSFLEKEIYEEFFPDQTRPLLMSVTGDRYSSPWRNEVLTFIETEMLPNSDCEIHSSFKLSEKDCEKKSSILWSVNPENRMPQSSYIPVLRNSDFILCIPGTSWTHRPFESLISGAIPIIEEYLLPFYNVPFKHMENCIIIKNEKTLQGWKDAIQTAISISPQKIKEMRFNIHSMRSSCLNLDTFKKNLSSKFLDL